MVASEKKKNKPKKKQTEKNPHSIIEIVKPIIVTIAISVENILHLAKRVMKSDTNWHNR